jgi:chromosome partitioning protein
MGCIDYSEWLMKGGKMIVECKRCQSRYNLDKNVFRGRSAKVRCTGCGFVFKAFLSSDEDGFSFTDLVLAKKQGANNVISVSNQKGGVAKTSTCLNLAFSLAVLNKRVLMIDFDIQANLTQLIGCDEPSSFYDLIHSTDQTIEELIVPTRFRNLSLLPSNKNMMVLNKWLFGAVDYEYILKDRLAPIKDKFDYILIDTPPSIDFFTINALTAASLVVIPSQCDFFSIQGMDQLLGIIRMVKGKLNPSLHTGILITMYDQKSEASKVVYNQIIDLHKQRVFKTRIEQDELIKEAQLMSLPVIYYNRKSSSGQAYMNLARELLERKAA